MRGFAVGVELNAQGTFAGDGEAVVGGFAVDEEAGSVGPGLDEFVGNLSAGRVALFTDDEEESDGDSLLSQLLGGGDLRGDDAFGVAGAAAVEVGCVLATRTEEGWDSVHVRRQDYFGRDVWECCIDVEAWGRSIVGAGGAWGSGCRCGDGLTGDSPPEMGEVVR
jgi:hypothetical protein